MWKRKPVKNFLKIKISDTFGTFQYWSDLDSENWRYKAGWQLIRLHWEEKKGQKMHCLPTHFNFTPRDAHCSLSKALPGVRLPCIDSDCSFIARRVSFLQQIQVDTQFLWSVGTLCFLGKYLKKTMCPEDTNENLNSFFWIFPLS